MVTPPKTTLNQMLKAWQKQLRATADKPWLFTLLMRQWARLFRRFARYYQRLLALPRPHKRALKRRLATTLAGAALMLALGQALPARAATIAVDGVTCTLAEAIDSANNDSAAGNGCIDGSGADVIDLQTDVTLSALLPDITSTITLEGNGHTINGNNAFRVLYVQSTGNLTLNEVTITGGHSTGSGGGTRNFGMLTLNNSTLSGNSADISGGGIFNNGTLTVNNSALSGNSASNGGGIRSVGGGGHLTVNNSTLSGNSASYGGSVSIFYGTLEANNSTLSGNSASIGGGIMNYYGTLTVNNSTLTGNSASNSGGGISNFGLYYATATANLNRSLISGNSAPNGAEVYNDRSGGVVNANNYNVVGYGRDARSFGFTPGPNDIIPPGALDTVLNTALADNGGSTLTHALVSGSVAIDAALNADCLAPPINGLDQRGFPRNVDGDGAPSSNECDAGAFEFAPSGRPTKTPTPTEMPRPTRTPTPRPTRTPTPPLIAAQESALVPPAQEQAANPFINIVIVTFLTIGNLLFFRKWRT